MTSMTLNTRIIREVKKMATTPAWGIRCRPAKENMYDTLHVTMQGPKDSPYRNGIFNLTVTITPSYPFEPPLIKFDTPVYHPNIDKDGRICMDMISMPPRCEWLPSMTLETLLVSVQALLADPDPDDPLMTDLADEYKNNIEVFTKKAQEYTEKYAMPLE